MSSTLTSKRITSGRGGAFIRVDQLLQGAVVVDVDQCTRAVAVEDERYERLLVTRLRTAVQIGAKRVFDLLREGRAARGSALLVGLEDLVVEPDRRSHAQERTGDA